MANVREEVFRVLREHGIDKVFGNDGYTELPFLTDFPDDFTYILGLQEASVIGMAEGYAQAKRTPVVVNLHSAPGVGNAMGNLQAAFRNRTPLILTAGQARRDMQLSEPGFFAVDARDLPKPYVKWSHEPARAEDVPAAFARAIRIATQAPAGPVFLSLPMDDWTAEAEPAPARTVTLTTAPDPNALDVVAVRLAQSRSPALIVGSAVDRAGGWQAGMALAERLRAAVYGAPGSSRTSFPENHELYRGGLAFARAALRERMEGHDLILVAGAAVFDYMPSQDGTVLPEGASLIQLTEDPAEAARALEGDAVVGDVRAALEGLTSRLPDPTRDKPAPGPIPPAIETEGPISADAVFAALESVRSNDTVVVLEAPSSATALHRRMKITRSGGFYNEGISGLGYGLPCSVGVGIAEPDARLVCAIGDGAFMYSLQSLWTAVQQKVRLAVVVLENGGYVVQEESGDFQGLGHEQPGLKVGGIDYVALANGLGLPGRRVEHRDELTDALRQALTADGPSLVSIVIDSRPKYLLS